MVGANEQASKQASKRASECVRACDCARRAFVHEVAGRKRRDRQSGRCGRRTPHPPRLRIKPRRFRLPAISCLSSSVENQRYEKKPVGVYLSCTCPFQGYRSITATAQLHIKRHGFRTIVRAFTTHTFTVRPAVSRSWLPKGCPGNSQTAGVQTVGRSTSFSHF